MLETLASCMLREASLLGRLFLEASKQLLLPVHGFVPIQMASY